MMEEVTIKMACDAEVVDQMSEDEILACLVAEARPKTSIPSKKAKLRGSQFLLEDDDDPVDRYQRENHVLQQTSLRLEQENDNLAHRLVTSKIALRNALDQAEDRVDELTKDLLQTRHRLQAAEEEKRGKQEEAAMLKEVFRRELEKAEQQITRSSGIVADYKQICSQLTGRLERQQTAHKQELDALKVAVMSCSQCRSMLEPPQRSVLCPGEQASAESPAPASATRAGAAGRERDSLSVHAQERDSLSAQARERDSLSAQAQERDSLSAQARERDSLSAQARELRRELAQTKLQVVEASVKIQELEHQRGMLLNDLQAAKNSWFSKTFTSLRTTNGGQHGISLPGDGAHTAGWALQRGPLSAWSSKRISWPHSRGHF